MAAQHPQIALFIRQLQALAASNDDLDQLLPEVAKIAQPLAADRSWIEADFYEANEDQGFAISVLHEEPDHRLLVETIAWLPGRGVSPHDHQTWGVVVGLDGTETNTNWRRLDDGSVAGYAEVEVAGEVIAGAGDCILLRPDDIHSVRNDGDETALSLHIYGRSLRHVNRSEFNPLAKTRQPCPIRTRR
jgi:predicted metal-dependent enzyme (double-stranded beta helix superfamily)